MSKSSMAEEESWKLIKEENAQIKLKHAILSIKE